MAYLKLTRIADQIRDTAAQGAIDASLYPALIQQLNGLPQAVRVQIATQLATQLATVSQT
jgi:hypothetical protein